MISSRTWTRELLGELIATRLGGVKFIVVSNREPHMHRYGEGGDLECIETTGGLATALMPILAATKGTWIAHGAGNADRDTVDEHDCQAAMEKWRRKLRLGDRLLGVGIERLDYTKGIPERLRALDCFIEAHPEWRGKFTFVQIAAPSRSHLPDYQAVEDEIEGLVDHLNWRWGRMGWQPVVFLKQQHGPVDMAALHRLCRFFIVNSLHDGMNLVAKEFAASRDDNDGVLILSRFTGASRELDTALGVNPFAIEETAQAIHQALTMEPEERERRMKAMREKVAYNNVYRWAGSILSRLMKLDIPEAP